MDRYNKVIDKQWDLQRREEACSLQAMGVSSGPLQNAWRVSRVTKSFHFCCSKGISQTFLRKFSYSSVILGWTCAGKKRKKEKKRQSVRYMMKPTRQQGKDTDDSPDSLTIPHVLPNPSSMPSHFVPLTKKKKKKKNSNFY